MSIYKNETKIYPDLNLTELQEPQWYWLNKFSEIEAFFLDEIEVREKLHKKMKRFNTITGIVGTGVITSTVITGGIFIAAFASGVGLPVGIVLSGTSLILSLATAISRKSFKIFTVISFVTPSRLQKSFWPFFYTSKNPSSSSSSLSMLHCWFSTLVYLHSSIYTWGWKFLPCL